MRKPWRNCCDEDNLVSRLSLLPPLVVGRPSKAEEREPGNEAVMRKQWTPVHESHLCFTDTKTPWNYRNLTKATLTAMFVRFFLIYLPSWPSRMPSHSHVAVLQIRMVRSCDPVTLKPSRRHGMTTVDIHSRTVRTILFLGDRALYWHVLEAFTFTKL